MGPTLTLHCMVCHNETFKVRSTDGVYRFRCDSCGELHPQSPKEYLCTPSQNSPSLSEPSEPLCGHASPATTNLDGLSPLERLKTMIAEGKDDGLSQLLETMIPEGKDGTLRLLELIIQLETRATRVEIRLDGLEPVPGAMSTVDLLCNDNAHVRGQVEDLVKQCQALRDRFHALAIYTGMPIDG